MMRILALAAVVRAACGGAPVSCQDSMEAFRQLQDHLETTVKPQFVAGLADNSKTKKELKDVLEK